MMQPELEPRQSGSKSGSLMHNAIAPLPRHPNPDPVTASQSPIVSLGAQSGKKHVGLGVQRPGFSEASVYLPASHFSSLSLGHFL